MSVESIIAKVVKDFGDGAAMLLSQKPRKIPVISSGIPQVDIALGVGGFPTGRIVEVYGPESSGKTTLVLHLIAQAQKLGHLAAFVDVEHALDPTYAKALGVDLDKLLFSQPDNGEEALGITESYIRSGECAVVAVDSVAALVPLAELNGEIGDAHIGLQARLMGQTLRMLTGVASKTKTILLFTNQIRMKIGVMFGSPETTPGGRALKFYASIRIDVRRIGGESEGSDKNKEFIGNKTKITIRKNKVAPPFKVAEATLIFGKGFDPAHNFLPTAVDTGFIQKKKNTYFLDGEKVGSSKKKAITALQEKYDIDELIVRLREYIEAQDKEKKLLKKLEKLENKVEEMDKDSDEYKKTKKRIKKLLKKLGDTDE